MMYILNVRENRKDSPETQITSDDCRLFVAMTCDLWST